MLPRPTIPTFTSRIDSKHNIRHLRERLVGRTPWSAADAPVGLPASCKMLMSLFRNRDRNRETGTKPRNRGNRGETEGETGGKPGETGEIGETGGNRGQSPITRFPLFHQQRGNW